MRRATALAVLAAAGCASTPDPAPAPARPELAQARQPLAEVEVKCAATGAPEAIGSPGDVQVIELWATWCAPCVKALPQWDALARRERIPILAVSIDDEREAPVRFAREHGIELPILWDPLGQRIAGAVPLGGVVPTTLVVDCAGKVRHKHEGFQGPEVVERVAAEVRELRRESTCKAPAELPRCAP